MNNFDVQVVGVTRPDFRVYLPPADHVEERVDVWLPLGFTPSRLYRGAALVGRLAPGATIAHAQAECDARAAAFVARIKMPNAGQGAWPAFWLASTAGIPSWRGDWV